MSATSGPNIVENGLVFCVDPGDSRSLVGEPTTNLLNNPTPLSISGYTPTGGTGSISYDPTTSSLIWQRNTYEAWGAFLNNDTLFNGTLNTSVQYTASFEWKQMGSISDASTSFQIVQANGISPAASANMIANSVEIENGFYRFSYTFTPTNSGIDAYFRVVNPSTTGTNIFYWRKLQLEQKSYRSTFTVGTRNTMSDISGSGFNTTLFNIPTFSSSNNGFLNFNGSNQYIVSNTDFPLLAQLFADATKSFSVAAWFKFPINPVSLRDNTINSGNCGYSIVTRQGGIGGAETFNILVGGTTTVYPNFPGQCFIGLRGTKTLISPGTVKDNTWHNCVVTYNHSTNSGKVYFDGNETNNLNVGTAAIQTGTNFSIGTTSGGDASFMYEGSISNVSVYNRALSATEVKQNFDALRRRFGV